MFKSVKATKATTRPRPKPPGKQPKKMGNIITVKLDLDTTEFENKLNRIEKKLEGINSLDVANRLSKAALKGAEATAELEEAFNNIKKVVVNNTYNNIYKEEKEIQGSNLMYIYEYINCEGHPYQSAIAVADNEGEALDIIIKATEDNSGWELEGKHEFKKGIVTWGDADC